MIRLIILIILFSSHLFADSTILVKSQSVFQEKLVTGYGFLIKTNANTYFMSPYHVLGGKQPMAESIDLSNPIYSNSMSDIVIYKVDSFQKKILFQFYHDCYCVSVNKEIFEANKIKKFQLSYNDFVVLPVQHKADHLVKFDVNLIHEYDFSPYSSSNHNNENLSGLRVYNAQTEGGFSGAPIADRFGRFRGMIVRYDPFIVRTFSVSESLVSRIIEKYERTGAIELQKSNEASSAQEIYVIAGKGGDGADGGADGQLSRVNDLLNEPSVKIDSKPVAYFSILNKPIFPNRVALDFISSLNINPRDFAVYLDDAQLNYLNILSKVFKNTNEAEAFEIPLNAPEARQIIGISKVNLTRDKKILIHFPFKKPIRCDLHLEFDQKGILSTESQFKPLLNINVCGEEIIFDLRDFYFINAENLSKSDFVSATENWLPEIKMMSKNSKKIYSFKFRSY